MFNFGDLSNPLISQAPICIGAVKDGDGDGIIHGDGTGDEDGDGKTDYFEACVAFTNPCDGGKD